jgi:tungstate transport system substrate-binding protein
MKRNCLVALALLCLVGCASPSNENKTVRVAVIGGMLKTGLWPELAKRFEAKTGYKTEVAMGGPKDLLDEAFRAGQADFLTMHSSDVATDLVADGFGMNMRPWARNEFVIVGPRTDPAGIRGMKDGAAALAKIAKARAPLVDFQASGPRELSERLWKKAGIRPAGDWLLKDESPHPEEVMEFARSKRAYVLLGRIPVLKGIFTADGMEILMEGDPEMRRPFIVMEANPQKVPNANVKGAHALAEFLLSRETQNFLLEFGTNSPGGFPLFYPTSVR